MVTSYITRRLGVFRFSLKRTWVCLESTRMVFSQLSWLRSHSGIFSKLLSTWRSMKRSSLWVFPMYMKPLVKSFSGIGFSSSKCFFVARLRPERLRCACAVREGYVDIGCRHDRLVWIRQQCWSHSVAHCQQRLLLKSAIKVLTHCRLDLRVNYGLWYSYVINNS